MAAPETTPSYGASDLVQIIQSLPPKVAFLMQGDTGVGKSDITRLIAKALGLPLVDIRLSLRNEGDMIGLPDQQASAERGVTCFAPPAWLKRACDEPVMLFLDEFNRAEKQVQNAAFQLVLDRQLGERSDGTPYTLHPETRIVAAINVGMDYSGVEDMDAALVRRFFIAKLVPDFGDWRKWAMTRDEEGETNIDPAIVEFLSENTVHWNADLSNVAPGSVFPTPATWHRLSDTLRYMGQAPSSHLGQVMSDVTFAVCSSAVGTTASASLRTWLKNAVQSVRAEEIFDPSLTKAKRKKLLAIIRKGGIEAQVSCVDQFTAKTGLEAWLKRGDLGASEALEILKEFIEVIAAERQSGCVQHYLATVARCKRDIKLERNDLQNLIMAASRLQKECAVRASKG